MTLEQVVAAIVSLSMPHPVRVAIDGITASGKTTLADELAVLVRRAGRPVIRVSVDDFHRSSAKQYIRGRLSPEGYYLDALDYAQLRDRLLLPLGPGGNRCYTTVILDQTTDLPIRVPEEQTAPSDAILLLDGVFLFRPDLNDLWDFRIFLDVELSVARHPAGSGLDRIAGEVARAIRKTLHTRRKALSRTGSPRDVC